MTTNDQKPGELRLYDRADGVRGRFCVGRLQPNGWTHEYWNDHIDGFTAFGTLIVGEAAAKKKMSKIAARLARKGGKGHGN